MESIRSPDTPDGLLMDSTYIPGILHILLMESM